jgi:excisionase family DNA binding protein
VRLNQRIGALTKRDLTTTEAANLIGMSHDFITRKCASGELQGYRFGHNGHWRIPLETLVTYATKNGLRLERDLRTPDDSNTDTQK